jgi:two-component system sensor histidine kinase UhpB
MLSRVHSTAPEGLRATLLEAQTAARSSLEDVRQIALELRPEALDDLGLESALAVLCARFAERSGLSVTSRIEEHLPQRSSEAELVIYRVAQEALTNVVRHSGSQRADLILEQDDGTIVLTVRDQGAGLGPDHGAGSGIRGMRERAALIGATIWIRDNIPGPGSEVRLQVPLADSA